MSATKAGLKAAKAALDAHKYEDAAKEARKTLEIDPKNYHASVRFFNMLQSER
jgi:superkiller protein 3